MIAFVSFRYGEALGMEQMPPDQWAPVEAKIRQVAAFANWKPYDLPAVDSQGRYRYLSLDERTIDLATEGAHLIALGLTFEVKRFSGCHMVATPEGMNVGTTNIQVAISDLGLLNIVEVQVIEDACTNQLQKELDAGWRLLAVCPPCSQRRPDYVMGRGRA